MTPAAALPQRISLLEPSTLNASARFMSPKIQKLIENLQNQLKGIGSLNFDTSMTDVSASDEMEQDFVDAVDSVEIDIDDESHMDFSRKKTRQVVDTSNTTVGSFSLEEYVIPVQPRKGKRNANQPEEELFQV